MNTNFIFEGYKKLLTGLYLYYIYLIEMVIKTKKNTKKLQEPSNKIHCNRKLKYNSKKALGKHVVKKNKKSVKRPKKSKKSKKIKPMKGGENEEQSYCYLTFNLNATELNSIIKSLQLKRGWNKNNFTYTYDGEKTQLTSTVGSSDTNTSEITNSKEIRDYVMNNIKKKVENEPIIIYPHLFYTIILFFDKCIYTSKLPIFFNWSDRIRFLVATLNEKSNESLVAEPDEPSESPVAGPDEPSVAGSYEPSVAGPDEPSESPEAGPDEPDESPVAEPVVLNLYNNEKLIRNLNEFEEFVTETNSEAETEPETETETEPEPEPEGEPEKLVLETIFERASCKQPKKMFKSSKNPLVKGYEKFIKNTTLGEGNLTINIVPLFPYRVVTVAKQHNLTKYFRIGDSIWNVNYYKGTGLNWGIKSAMFLFNLIQSNSDNIIEDYQQQINNYMKRKKGFSSYDKLEVHHQCGGDNDQLNKEIVVFGGGPVGMFIVSKLLELDNVTVSLYEKRIEFNDDGPVLEREFKRKEIMALHTSRLKYFPKDVNVELRKRGFFAKNEFIPTKIIEQELWTHLKNNADKNDSKFKVITENEAKSKADTDCYIIDATGGRSDFINEQFKVSKYSSESSEA